MTDGQTDGRTDRIAISISRIIVLTSDKNETTVYGPYTAENAWFPLFPNATHRIAIPLARRRQLQTCNSEGCRCRKPLRYRHLCPTINACGALRCCGTTETTLNRPTLARWKQPSWYLVVAIGNVLVEPVLAINNGLAKVDELAARVDCGVDLQQDTTWNQQI